MEFQTKREKGLCFCNNEKFYLGHWCWQKTMKELRLFVMQPNVNELELFYEMSEEAATVD